LPLEIEDIPELIEIRHEVHMDDAIFRKINEERRNAGETLFANARNLPSRTLKLMDSEEVQSVEKPIDAGEPVEADQ
jgi:DNA ligase (NAD+)